MRLTILNQFFYPDHSATSQLMTALAEALAQHNVTVTALASRGSYNGGPAFAPREVYRGVKIERVWATSFGKQHLWGRLSDYVTFYLGAFWKLLTLPLPKGEDAVVMALTTPPLIGLVALVVGHWRGMRFITLQQDLYPDVAVALGALPADGLLTRLLERLTRVMLRRADRIIVLSECMLERVTAKLGEAAVARIDVIHNWADGAEIVPLTAESEKARFFAERNLSDLSDKFVVLFSGNLGLVNEFATVLEAARLLRHRRDIAFVFVGAGARGAEINSFVSQHRLENVIRLPYQARAELNRTLGASDVLLITLGDGLAGLSVPSKAYSNLAAGRPLLFVGDRRSSTATLINQHGCGAALANGASALLAETIVAWAADKPLVAAMGLRARALFEQRYNQPHAVKAYLRSLAKCCERQSIGDTLEDYARLDPADLKEPVS